MTDPRIERWLEALVRTPGLTAVRDPVKARRLHVDESLGALETVERFEGSIVDVGSGGGAPGIPLAAALPLREVTLLESHRRTCDFLEGWTREFPNLRVVCGRAEEQPVDSYGVAVAKALAPPPVAAEWCLPLVAPGGAVVLFVGPSARGRARRRGSRAPGRRARGVASRDARATEARSDPVGFPRRPGIARKRPLA